MFHLVTRDKYIKFNTILKFVFFVFFACPILTSLVVGVLLYIDNKDFDFIFNWIIICTTIFISVTTLFYITSFLMNIRWRKLMIQEFINITKKSQIKKDSKVVYVYTTHNDFMKARLLQNLEQTYKNIEVWISVGGLNDVHLKEIKKVAQEKNIKLCIMNRPSKSKADNLNYFLKNSGATFDYLLIGDADVAFDANFVETSLKLFHSDRAKRLGYVSSTIFNYRGNNVFTNAIMNFENKTYVLDHQITNYVNNMSRNLYSACCLISNEMLQEMGGLFPNSNLEDWYAEKYANKHLWEGVISPLSVAMQSFDQNIWINLNRLSRLFTWGIKYNKEQFFKKNNYKYYIQNQKDFNNVLFGLYFITGFIGTSLLCWILVTDFYGFINNKWNQIVIFSTLINLIIILIIKSFYARKISKTDNIKRFLLSPFYGISIVGHFFKQWFLALFFAHYSPFESKQNVKNQFQKSLILLSYWISLLLIFNSIAFNFLSIENKVHAYFIVAFNLVMGFLAFYELSLIILHLSSKISSNKKFNENDFVYCQNTFVLPKKITKKGNKNV